MHRRFKNIFLTWWFDVPWKHLQAWQWSNKHFRTYVISLSMLTLMHYIKYLSFKERALARLLFQYPDIASNRWLPLNRCTVSPLMSATIWSLDLFFRNVWYLIYDIPGFSLRFEVADPGWDLTDSARQHSFIRLYDWAWSKRFTRDFNRWFASAIGSMVLNENPVYLIWMFIS